MGEETRDAKRAVPRAVFWSVATNIALGLVMIITFGVSYYLSLYLQSSFKTSKPGTSGALNLVTQSHICRGPVAIDLSRRETN